MNEGRWWEFYGVRYAMGTVIGALIVYFLFSKNSFLKPLLLLPNDPKDFGGAHLMLLAGYGLTFCYLSSAPVLILHACRCVLPHKRGDVSFINYLASYCSALFIPALVGMFVYYFTNGTDASFWKTAASVILSIILAIQVVLIIRVFFSKRLVVFYSKLITERTKYENKQYVESYRHLREHGNSFFIVFFEFILGLIIFCFTNIGDSTSAVPTAASTVTNLFIIVFLWAMPGMIAWFIGIKMEYALIEGMLGSQESTEKFRKYFRAFRGQV